MSLYIRRNGDSTTGKEMQWLILVARALPCSAHQMQVLAVLLVPRIQAMRLTSQTTYLVRWHQIGTLTMGSHQIRSHRENMGTDYSVGSNDPCRRLRQDPELEDNTILYANRNTSHSGIRGSRFVSANQCD